MIPPGVLHRERLPLDSISGPVLPGVWAAYQAMRGSATVLAYADLRPERFGAALHHIALIDVADGRRFRVRLAGSEIENRKLGYVAGAHIDAIAPKHYRKQLLAAYADGVREAAPLYERVESRYDFGTFDYDRLILPITRDGHSVGMLLVATQRSRRLAVLMDSPHTGD